MGDDLTQPERNSVRTAMQWSAAPNGGFSSTRPGDVGVPVVSRGAYSFRKVNAADQARDDDSLLQFVRRVIRARRELPEVGLGTWQVLRVRQPSVLALRYETDDSQLLAVHNLAAEPVQATGLAADGLVDAFANRAYPPPGRRVELDGYGFRWLRPADAP